MSHIISSFFYFSGNLFGRISSNLNFTKGRKTEDRYIALRTTTGDIITYKTVNNHLEIAKFNESSISDVIQIAKNKK